MPIPTYQNVYDSARSLLGDDQTAGGEVYTNTLLQPFCAVALREMWRAMESVQNPQIIRVVYYTLPAYTTTLVPATANISDLAAPLLVEERGSLTTYILTGASINASVPSVTWTTASTTGLGAGTFVTLNGASGLTGTDGFWGVANVTPTTFDTLGMVSTGVFSGAPIAVVSPEQFTEVVQAGGIDNQFINSDTRGTLGEYFFYNGAFHFPPCTQTRQLRITYESDGSPSSNSSDSVGVEDSLNFLAARTSGLAAASRGNTSEAEYLNRLALGPVMDTSQWAGYLGELLAAMVRTVQNRPPQLRRKPPFRQPRASTPSIW